MEGYKDFEKARPFMDQVEGFPITTELKLLDSQVAREGTGMVIPKSCCILKQDSNFLLIKPEVHTKKIGCTCSIIDNIILQDPSCVRSPKESNSFLYTVSIIIVNNNQVYGMLTSRMFFQEANK